MPKIRGFFDNFAHADEIAPEQILKWLGPRASLQSVANYMGNRFLYPQTIPQSPREVLIDLALLREVVKLNIQNYYDPVARRIFVPEESLSFFPDPVKLVMAFIDVLPLSGITTVWTKGHTLGSLGMVITPDKVGPSQSFTLHITGDKEEMKPQTVEVKTGSVMAIPVYCQNLSLHFSSKQVSLNGEHDLKTQAVCGMAGIIVDSRIK